MGKKSRKIAKTQQKSQQMENRKEISAKKAEMKDYMIQEDYARALETLAELIDRKYYEAELMYDGAYAYFMLGDYPRAINWVNTTLTYDPAHVQARILLGRICILEDRTEDGLAIFDFVLENHRADIAEELLDEMEEVLAYYGRNEADKLKKNYPHIADFLNLGKLETSAMVDTSEKMEVKPTDTAETKAKSMIAEMKSLMQADDEQLTAEPAVKAMCCEEPLQQEEKAEKQSVVDVLATIQDKKVSLLEKIRFCNAFAGAAYMSGNLAEAREYLAAALEIDACHEQTLRNMIRLELRAGQKEQALAYAANLPWSDFALLDQLRDC